MGSKKDNKKNNKKKKGHKKTKRIRKEEKELQLNFEQRKDRFLVVTTVVGVLVIVLKYLLDVSKQLFAKFYIKSVNVLNIDNLFISYDQVASVIYIASFLIIIILFIVYCICELYNFQKLEDDVTMENYADKMYALVFETALFLVIMTGILAVFAISFFSDSVIGIIISSVFVVICLLIIVIIWKSAPSKEKEVIKSKICNFMKTFVVLITLSCFSFCVLFLNVYNNQGSLTMYYETEKITLKFESIYHPEEIKCIIKCPDGIIVEERCSFKQYGECAWVEKISLDEERQNKDTFIYNNYYCYVYNIDISDWCKSGKNEIQFEFEINENIYHIHNTLYYDGQYDYTKEEIQMDL